MGATYGHLRKKVKHSSKKRVIEKKLNKLNKDNIKRNSNLKNLSKLNQILKEGENECLTIAKSQTFEQNKKSRNAKDFNILQANENGPYFCDNNNHEEINRESLETNFGSNKSNNEIDNALLTEDNIDKISEDDNESEDNEENEDKLNEYKITNNIKTVFVYSKTQGKDYNLNIDEENYDNNYSERRSSATFDYELNFYKSGNEIRESYISKLIIKKVWNPSIKPKRHNSIIIFDWDDTLLPTSFFTTDGVFNEDMKISADDKAKFLKIEQVVFKLLSESIEKGNVYIITNAGTGWVEYSALKFYSSISSLLPKIKIISAREEYEKIYPDDTRQWKIQAFLTLLKNVDVKLVTNIVCIGDSLFEMEAGRTLASKFTEAFIKTVKFKEAPNLDELLNQLKIVSLQFGTIYSSIKNLTIRVEKKRKNNDRNSI